MAKDKSSTGLVVDVARVAQEFGCTDRTIQGLVKLGMPKAGHGRYDLLACFRWYVAKLRDEAKEQELDPLEQERKRLTMAQADLAEIELAKARGLLIPIETYKQHTLAHLNTVRQRFLQLPAQIAPQLEGEERGTIKVKVRTAVCNVLAVLSTGEDVINATASADTGSAGESDSSNGADARSTGSAAPGRPGNCGSTRTTTRREYKRVGRKKPGAEKGHQ